MRDAFFGHAARGCGKTPMQIKVVRGKKHPKKDKAARGAEAMDRVMQRAMDRNRKG